MRQIKFILSLIIIFLSIILCQRIVSNSLHNQKNKVDYAELNHIKYGLFSVDIWKQKISKVLYDEINKLDISKVNTRDLKKQLESLLNALIDKIDANIREGNKGSLKGWVKQKFINIFLNLKEIKKGIPGYADTLISELAKPETKVQVRRTLHKLLNQYLKESFDTQDTGRLKTILSRLDAKTIDEAKERLGREIAESQAALLKMSLALIALSLFHFMLPGRGHEPLIPSQYIFLVLTLILLLIAGVSTPMIDLEAKIEKMHFVLLGHEIVFKNQVLYFQSKSILDVFRILITNKDIQMKFVGVLVVTFSIIFPITKIISTVAYYFNFKRAKENKIIQFFVLKSGKWSMADVLVVAIFMAYVGLNGIITNQLNKLNTAGESLELMTTNGTMLQPGYYLFLTYTFLGIFLAGYLSRKKSGK